MRIFTVIIIFICISAFSQNDSARVFNCGIQLSGGVSKLSNNLIPIRNEVFTTSFDYSVYSGFYVTYKLFQDVILESGLFYNQINSKWNYYFNTSLNVEAYDYFEIHYISIPLIYTYTISRFGFGLGAQYSYLITNSFARESIGDSPYQYDYWIAYDRGLKKSDLSFTTTFTLRVTRKFLIEAMFNKGLIIVTDINDGWVNESKSQQFLFGIKYNFLK